MNVVKWTIGMAVIALGASTVLAQPAAQTAFNGIALAGCCEEPSCCCDQPCCGAGCGSACGGLGLGLGGCELGEAFTLSSALLGGDAPFVMGGWTQLGFHTQQTPLSNNFNDLLAFNDVSDQLNLHQQWMFFERVADGSRGPDWGFRFDILYGTDAQKTQAFGNDEALWDDSLGFDYREYGWALPQAYLELATGDWSVIAGHFFTLVGYEVVAAPDNFFYSHAYTQFNSEPFTHTGVLSTYSGFENLELYGGWTAGWDTGFDQYNRNGTRGSSFLGGFSASLMEDVALTYICTFGDLGARSDGQFYVDQATNPGDFAAAAGVQDRGAYSHSIVVDVAMSDRFNYVFQSDLVAVGDGVGHDQVGVNQYLFYTLNDCLALGSRLEWWRSDSQDFHEITFGLNYRPHANVVLRPEVRYDWTPVNDGFGESPAGSGVFRDDVTTFGMDCVITY